MTNHEKIIFNAHRMLDMAYRFMFENDMEAMKCVFAGVREEDDAKLIAKKLNLKVMTRGLISHDRVLTHDRRGEWRVWL